jgi:spermidine synthase
MLTTGRYDVVISDPSNPWMAGVASLFTVEYYRLVRERLAADGILAQWLQLYSIHPDDVRSVMATLREVFPHVELWATADADLLLIASDRPHPLDLERADARIDASPAMRASLRAVGLRSSAGLLASFRLTDAEVAALARGGRPNTDGNLRLEFGAARMLFEADALAANRKILSLYRRETFPPSVPPVAGRIDRLVEVADAWLDRADHDRVDRAREYLSRAHDIDGTHVPTLVALARGLIAEGKATEAMTLLAGCAQVAPSNATVHAYAGLAAWRGGDTLNAVRSLRRAAELAPADAAAWEWLGRVHLERQEFPAAVEALTEAAGLQPSLPRTLWLAEALRKSARTADAMAVLRPVLSAHPREAASVLEFWRAAMAGGDRERMAEATGILEQAAALNPWQDPFWLALGRLYAVAGHPEDLERIRARGRRCLPYFDAALAALVERAADDLAATPSTEDTRTTAPAPPAP